MSAFVHVERALARQLGVQQTDLRQMREEALERGTHWKHERGEVRYSDEGLALLRELLKISDAAPPPPPDPAPLAPARAELLGVIVARADGLRASFAAEWAAANAALAQAAEKNAPAAPLPPEPATAPAPAVLAPPQPGEERELQFVRSYPLNKRILLARLGALEVRVRVACSDNFRTGMTLKARLVGADLWELAQRAPRWPGKW